MEIIKTKINQSPLLICLLIYLNLYITTTKNMITKILQWRRQLYKKSIKWYMHVYKNKAGMLLGKS
jgi:hypothetical protein